jgi:glycerate 2-kinase
MSGEARIRLTERFRAAVAAVEPRTAVLAALRREGEELRCGAWSHRLDRGRVVVVGAGKASAPMAAAIEDLCGGRIGDGSVVVVKYGYTAPLARIRLHEAAHPVPDAAGAEGARLIEEAVGGLAAEDLVIVCLSGGASALLPSPRPPLTLAELRAMTGLLLASGCDIHQMNTVRKHLSRLAGGRLAAACAPARVLTLAVSDVSGDDLTIIGSGPTAADPSSDGDALAIIEKHLPAAAIPPAVCAVLADGAAWTPKPGDPLFDRVHQAVVASNAIALSAVGAQVCAPALAGEASLAAERFCAFAAAQAPGTLIAAGGETTVTLGDNPGLGGRNQEFALAAARWIDRHGVDLTVLAGGTDGGDGPTDAAGGLVDRTTWQRDPAAARHLAGHDAYPLLKRLGCLVVTGPTNTNVMDVALAWRA